MSEIIFNIYVFLCRLLGGSFDVSWLDIPASYIDDYRFTVDGTAHISYSNLNGVVDTVWLSYDGTWGNITNHGIIYDFANAIVTNPIVLFFVVAIVVFVGIKLLRRLCDA